MLKLIVKQGSAEEELQVPEAMLITELGSYFAAWEHASKFTLTETMMDKTVLDLDGDEYEWETLVSLEETPLSTIVGEAENPTLVLGAPPEEQAVAELLPVVSALNEPLESLLVHTGVTILGIHELLSKAYDGDLDATVVQMRGRMGSSFLSLKLSAVACPALPLMDCVSARVSRGRRSYCAPLCPRLLRSCASNLVLVWNQRYPPLPLEMPKPCLTPSLTQRLTARLPQRPRPR